MARRRPILDAQLLLMLTIAVALAWWRGGETWLRAGLADGSSPLLRYGILIAVSCFAAGFAQALIPSEWIPSALGRDSGL